MLLLPLPLNHVCSCHIVLSVSNRSIQRTISRIQLVVVISGMLVVHLVHCCSVWQAVCFLRQRVRVKSVLSLEWEHSVADPGQIDRRHSPLQLQGLQGLHFRSMGVLILRRALRCNSGNYRGTAGIVPVVNRTFEWGVLIATFLCFF